MVAAPMATASRPRPTRNSVQECVVAQISVPTAKAMPTANSMLRLPYRSDSLPRIGVEAPPTRPKMMVIHETLLPTPGKFGPMTRAAGETIVYWSGATSAKSTMTAMTVKIRAPDAPSRRPVSGSVGGLAAVGSLIGAAWKEFDHDGTWITARRTGWSPTDPWPPCEAGHSGSRVTMTPGAKRGKSQCRGGGRRGNPGFPRRRAVTDGASALPASGFAEPVP